MEYKDWDWGADGAMFSCTCLTEADRVLDDIGFCFHIEWVAREVKFWPTRHSMEIPFESSG